MATPQRNFPDEPREPEIVEERRTGAGRINDRTIDTRPIDDPRVARRAGGASFFWVWIVLFIAAIIWFCGWGWGGYGGWWWGRGGAANTVQPYNNGTGSNAAPATTGNAAGTAGSGTAAGPNGSASGTTGNGGRSTAPAGNGSPQR